MSQEEKDDVEVIKERLESIEGKIDKVLVSNRYSVLRAWALMGLSAGLALVSTQKVGMGIVLGGCGMGLIILEFILDNWNRRNILFIVLVIPMVISGILLLADDPSRLSGRIVMPLGVLAAVIFLVDWRRRVSHKRKDEKTDRS